jgi:hypothetical protein
VAKAARKIIQNSEYRRIAAESAMPSLMEKSFTGAQNHASRHPPIRAQARDNNATIGDRGVQVSSAGQEIPESGLVPDYSSIKTTV